MLPFVSQCQEWLWENKGALSYLVDQRHMTPDSIIESGVGYFPSRAPFSGDWMKADDVAQMRGRIVVPIYSEFGSLVGMASRATDPNKKGWWNTRFPKASHLYGFNVARKSIFEHNKAYVFEGYFDRIIMAQYGLQNSVAVMSSSLAIRRVGMLARYCEKLCLCFDTDENDSGFLGVLKSLADMYSVGIGSAHSNWELTMVKLPKGEDPDEFTIKNGLDAFLSLERSIPEEKLKLAGRAHDELKWKNKKKKNEEHPDGK